MPGASRSPCPGLNAVANHGFLSRSGLNIDFATPRSAVAGAYNYKPTAFDGPFQKVMNFNLTAPNNSSTFHLADLAKHDAIEFDGSLSRNDFALGENLHFDHAMWATVAKRLRLYKTGRSKMDKYITVEMAAKARAARVRDAMVLNKNFNASKTQLGDDGTVSDDLWDFEFDAAPKAWVKAFFALIMARIKIAVLDDYQGISEPKFNALDLEKYEPQCANAPFPAALLNRLPNLKLLLTTSLRNLSLDLPILRERSIPATGAIDRTHPGANNSVSTTEHCVALILAAARISRRMMRERADERARRRGGVEREDGEKVFKVLGKEELFKMADVVSVHLVLSERSRGW
ncbi:hypothetical protein N0V88_006539 [Collariella sp. IMI 366227]|nr:hypothetical protein N0V88_006539 [Collariella sp. IMI 366227]